MKSDHIEGISSFAQVRIVPYTLCPILLASSCNSISLSDSVVLLGKFFSQENNQLLTLNYSSLQSLELIAGRLVIVAVQHLTIHNHEYCIWQLWDVTSHFVACAHSQICHRLLVSLPFFLPYLLNFTCTFLETHLHPLSLNPFSIINDFRRPPFLESLQKSATAISQCSGPSCCCLKQYSSGIMD